MAVNENVNKVVYGNNTLIDLTNDTVVPEALVDGYTAHDRSGATVTGTLELPSSSNPLPVEKGGTNANAASDARTNLDVYSKSEVANAIQQSTAYVTEYVNIGAEDMLAKIAQMSADKMIYFRTTGTTTNGPRSGIYLIGTVVRAGNNITITASEMVHPETIYQNSTNNAGSTWAGWSGIGCAVFNSATPSTVYTMLSSIGIGKSIPFIITNSDAASLLTGGKSTSLLKGIVARTGETGTLYDFISGTGGNQYMYTWRVTAESASSITPGTVYRYTGTAI